MAAVLLLGRRAVPGVALGVLLFNASTPVPLWVSAAIALGNTLEALTGAWLLRRAGFSVGLWSGCGMSWRWLGWPRR